MKEKLMTKDLPKEIAPSLSEAELLAQNCGNGVVRLEGNWKKILKEMPRLGPIRCHTGNNAILHDRFGPYRWVRFIFNAGQTGGPEVDLRLFMQNWNSGFAVAEQTEGGLQRSFQFFGKHGDPLHKIFLTPESDKGAFDTITQSYRSKDQSTAQSVTRRGARKEKDDSEVDVAAFQKKWRKMWDTHQFFGLHRKFGLHRLQALRLGPPELVRPLTRDAGRRLFQRAQTAGVGFMTFSGNSGCLQIYKGTAQNLKTSAEWFRVREPDFHLDIHEPSIAYAYEVKKPTLFGLITSVELFDERGDNVAVFYGKRRRIEPEHADWRDVVAGLNGDDHARTA